MKSKHIVIVTPYYAPAWAYGGVPRVLSTLAQELVKQGYTVSVITTDSLGEKRAEMLVEVIHGVSVHRYRSISNTLCYKQKLFFVPFLLSQSNDILQNADAVLFSDVRAPFSGQLFSYTIKQKIPYGVFLFGQVERGEGLKSVVKYIFDLLWVRRFIKHAQCLFAQTNHEKKSAELVYGAKPAQIFLSVLPIPGLSTVSKAKISNFKTMYGIPPNATLLLFVGRLHYLKGVDLLLEAVSPLLRTMKDCYLCIVGRDDGVEQTLKANIPKDLKKKIVFTGPLYGDDAKVAYGAANLFLFTPRFFEETSTAALESLAAGTPTITTEQAQTPYVEEYKAGKTISNTPLAIQTAIIQMLEIQKKNPSEFIHNAKKLIQEKYLVQRVAAQIRRDMNL